MSKTRDTGFLGNVIKVDTSGNVSFVSGSTTLATINTSGQLSGSSPVLSSSYALNADLLDGLDSTQFTLTSSFNAQTASFTAFTASVNSFTASQLVLNGTYATTGSNTFAGIQTINSNLIVTGSITAQTLVVQTITSSVDFVTGSTRFGSSLSTSTHQFTGSVSITGSLDVITNGTEFQVTSTGVKFGNVIGDAHNITGSVSISGSLSGTSATFSGGATFFNGGNTFIFSQNVLTSGNADGAHIRNVISTAANPTYAWSGDTDTGMYSDTANTIGFSTSGSERIRVNSSGTAIFSGGNSSDVNTTAIRILNTKFLTFYNAAATGWAMTLGANADNTGGIGANAGLYLQTGGSLDTRMFIASGGSIGIGTTSPDRRFTINSGASEGAFGLTSNNGVEIDMVGYGTGFTYPQARIKLTDDGFYGGSLSIWTKPNGAQANALAERMRVTGAGRVGIGTTGPDENLHVTNTGSDTVMKLGGGGAARDTNFSIFSQSAGNTVTAIHYNGQMAFYSGKFTIQSSGAASLVGALTQNTSDIRLKTNIAVIENAINKIKQLSGFTYNWNSLANELGGFDTTIKEIGVAAQSVKEVVPEAVFPAPFDNEFNPSTQSHYSKSGENYLTVQYEKLVPLLIEGIKELKAENDTLKEILQRNNIQ